MTLLHKSRMVNALCCQIGGLRFLRGFEGSKPNTFPIDPELSNPSSAIFSPMHTAKSGLIVLANLDFVLHVDYAATLSKIANSVISFIAVYMVNFLKRGAPIDIEPREVMGGVIPAVHIDHSIARSMSASGNTSNADATLVVGKTSEYSGNRIVTQKLFQPVLGNHISSLAPTIL